MKYNNLNYSFSTEQREQHNKSVINCIKKRKATLSAEEIFNYFTGKGQLHHLSYNDFNNYSDYAKAKKEIEVGQFFTPHELCYKIITALQPSSTFKIADLTCGKGSFFNFLPKEQNCYGCELDQDTYKVCKYLFPQAHITKGDFIYYTVQEKFDLIIGNPPFNLRTEKGLSQWAYLMKSEELLKFSGLLAVIVPESFLADEFQDTHKIDWLNTKFHFVLQAKLPAGSFNAVIDTKLLILQKKAIAKQNTPYSPETFIPFEPELIFSNYIRPIYEFNQLNAARIHLYTIQHSIGNNHLSYQIKKCLWHIKSNPVLNKKHYKKALNRIDEIKTKRQPANMDYGEWEKIRPTPEKIYRWLKTVLHHQNDPKPKKEIKIVKTSYGIKYKAYHPQLKGLEWKKSDHDLLLTGETFQPYAKLYQRKQKALRIQNIDFVQMRRCADIDLYLNRLRLRPQWQKAICFRGVQAPIIALNTMQKIDLGLLLQKRYAILAWEQGAGKSVAGIAWLNYWKKHYKVAFILAPALAINLTWNERLSIYGFDHSILESVSDFEKIRPGQIVIISYERLIILQDFIKRFVKLAAYKIALLVDESDELTNAGSQRSLAALKCFRKAKLKLLTTGTTTRNTINELYTQLELVYNNSTAFRCWAELIYRVDESGSLVECINKNCGYPFPAYHGKALFKAAFCPQRITVFGIRQDTQDIYNSKHLKDIISKTIITRKFEEIVGEKKYSIITHAIKQSSEEKDLYRILMQEFLTVCYHYYTSTGNSRKEAALRLIRQIKALIKATSTPHLMRDFTGRHYPEKYYSIASLIMKWPNELVTIGTTFKTSARNYLQFLKQEFPHRQVFYIDGEIPVPKRREILEQFHQSENGILDCTQQSLKSSVNIPYCHKCIIESLQWNIPKMSQFYFRFIRFDSPKHVEVHFVNYSDTIEVNLLALLMAKEKLNDFIKTTNEKTSAAIYHQFGIDLNILDSLITKEWDSEGKLKLRWGKQTLY
jgi:hypothetical protein